ncbi:MAG: hypothetical protein JXA73_11955 [Acidobacteria bacterium]|nr:hypothetical protein [Acidobacteriota bacterium]
MTADSMHNLYIIGGEPATLVKLTAQGKQLFRRKYSEFQAGQIYPSNGKVYAFDNGDGNNNLYVLNAENGQIEKTFNKITENQINSYCFADGKLIVHAFGFGAKNEVGTKLRFSVFDLNGKFVGVAENPYNISAFNYPEKYQKESMVYLGKYKAGYMFNYWDVDNGKYVLILVAGDGKMQASAEIQEDAFGKMLYGGIREFWSLHGNWITVLGKKDKQAIITTIKIDKHLKAGAELDRPKTADIFGTGSDRRKITDISRIAQ